MEAGPSSMATSAKMAILLVKNALHTNIRRRMISAEITNTVNQLLKLKRVTSLVEHMEKALRRK